MLPARGKVKVGSGALVCGVVLRHGDVVVELVGAQARVEGHVREHARGAPRLAAILRGHGVLVERVHVHVAEASGDVGERRGEVAVRLAHALAVARRHVEVWLVAAEHQHCKTANSVCTIAVSPACEDMSTNRSCARACGTREDHGTPHCRHVYGRAALHLERNGGVCFVHATSNIRTRRATTAMIRNASRAQILPFRTPSHFT